MDYGNNNNSSVVMGISPFKKTKSKKKKPMKVVYISNPMKFKTSASEFRALVQELTGQDSELPPDPNKVLDSVDDNDDNDGGDQTVLHEDSSLKEDHAEEEHNRAIDLPTVDAGPDRFENNDVSGTFESFDDVFVPQMLENLSGLMPSALFYESAMLM